MPAIDLSTVSDRDVLRMIAKEKPDLGLLLGRLIDRGQTDEEIIRMVAMANGSGQAMHYVAKCLRAMRAAIANGEV